MATSFSSCLSSGSLAFSVGAIAAPEQQQPEAAEQQKLHDIAAHINADNIERDITKLVSFGTRHTLSETASDTRGIGAARRWIKPSLNASPQTVAVVLRSTFKAV